MAFRILHFQSSSQGDLGKSQPAAIWRDPFTDADHEQTLPRTSRAAGTRRSDRDKSEDEGSPVPARRTAHSKALMRWA